MTTEHPITPPPELVQQWLTEGHHQDYCSATNHAIARAARWGADIELEACCEYLQHKVFHGFATELRQARRPKPPSLAEGALEAWFGIPGDRDIIRRALEQLRTAVQHALKP